MDVSPKTLREVEFREKMRGYHPEDVDQFLERVAAGIEVLQDRLRQAIERAQRAEQAASEFGGNDDALRRTLVLAQRTADLAVQEAREQAARILAGAEQQAQSVIAEADERARRAHDEALTEARSELSKLESSRQQLQMDVDNLTHWVDEHRVHLRATLQEALARIDQADLLAPPPVSRSTEGPPGRPSGPSAEPLPGGTSSSEGADTVAWQPDGGERDDQAEGGDPYLAELRRAVSEPEPPGPRTDDDVPPPSSGVVPPDEEFYDQDLADAKRFGGRLRRRR